MAKTKITLKIAQEIANRFKAGEKRQDVYKDYPFNQSSVLYALKRYGLWFKKYETKPTPNIQAVLDHREMLENGSISARELAIKIGCTPVYISVLAKKHNIKLYYSKHRGRGKGTTDEVSQQVLDHLVEHGGTVNSAARDLGIGSSRVQQAVRSYARRIGFDTAPYRIAHQRFGLWKILPGTPEPCYTADYRVDALCTGCNTVHSVLIGNLRSGASSGCHHCNRYKGDIQVRCVETSEVFRSIHSLSEELNLKYQKVRMTLRDEGIFEYLGFSYIFET